MINDPEIMKDVIFIFHSIIFKHMDISKKEHEENWLEPIRVSAEKAKTNSKYLKGLKMAFNDVLHDIEGLNLAERKDFLIQVKKKCGINILEFEGRITTQIKNIVKKNKISDDYEYYLIQEAVEKAFQNNDSDNIEKFNNLLISFEDSR